MQGTSMLGKHMGRNVFIFMRGSCAVHARGAGPITRTSTMTLAGTGKQNILYNDLLYHRVPADMGPQSHDVSWYGGV